MNNEENTDRKSFMSPEHLLSAIVDSSDDAIISKDLNGIVTSWNKGAERMFGYTAAEMIGLPVLTLIPKDRLEEEPLILGRLRIGERVDHFETKRVRKNGELLDISLSISPVKNTEGKIVGASKIARDITLQKQAADTLRKATEEIKRQSRMKEEFLATLSHELRTPLQSILGWVQILRGDGIDTVEIEEGLAVIDRNARAQQRIIEDLLDMNSILSGKVRLDVQSIELAPLIEAALATVRPAAKEKKISLHAILDQQSMQVSGDPQRLQQVFWNLLNNAVKFTPAGGRIEVLLQRVNSHLEVTVTDSGMGITDDFLPYVFDRFRQADASYTRKQGGLGLGLAIVKHLVELHGGQVAAKSMGKDQGATFSIMLPVAALESQKLEGPFADEDRERLDSASLIPQLNGIYVLVVDDDMDSRELVARTLSKSGAEVKTASSADQAFIHIDDRLPHILVVDIGMPEKDGFTFIKELRQNHETKGGKIPAVALTAYTRVEDRVRALSSGFQILLSKPVNSLELLATVASFARNAE